MTTQLPRLRSRLGTLTSALLGLLLLTAPVAQAAPFAYISNSSSNTVSVIDTASNTVTATVAVGTRPRAFGLFIGGTAGAPPPTSTTPFHNRAYSHLKSVGLAAAGYRAGLSGCNQAAAKRVVGPNSFGRRCE